MDIRINKYIPITKTEGPGARFVIWVQGCSLHCEGCANFLMWDKNGGTKYNVDEIIDLIKIYSYNIEGITFLGGEPLEQIVAVKYISKSVQKMKLSVLLFTGFDYQAIKNRKDIKDLIKYVDVLIDGKYEKNKQDFSRAWVGSLNQNYYFFTDRYDESIITKYKNKFELRIDKNNKIFINGMGDYSKIANIVR